MVQFSLWLTCTPGRERERERYIYQAELELEREERERYLDGRVVEESSLREDGNESHHSKEETDGVKIHPLYHLVESWPLQPERERKRTPSHQLYCPHDKVAQQALNTQTGPPTSSINTHTSKLLLTSLESKYRSQRASLQAPAPWCTPHTLCNMESAAMVAVLPMKAARVR